MWKTGWNRELLEASSLSPRTGPCAFLYWNRMGGFRGVEKGTLMRPNSPSFTGRLYTLRPGILLLFFSVESRGIQPNSCDVDAGPPPPDACFVAIAVRPLDSIPTGEEPERWISMGRMTVHSFSSFQHFRYLLLYFHFYSALYENGMDVPGLFFFFLFLIFLPLMFHLNRKPRIIFLLL